jgi:hypothetical protein
MTKQGIATANELHKNYVNALNDWQTDQVQERVALWSLVEKVIRTSKSVDEIQTADLYKNLDVDDALETIRTGYENDDKYELPGPVRDPAPPKVTDEPSVHEVLMLDEYEIYPDGQDTAPDPLLDNQFIRDGRKFVENRMAAEYAANELVSYLKFGDRYAMQVDAKKGGGGNSTIDEAVRTELEYKFSAYDELDPAGEDYNEFLDDFVTGRFYFDRGKRANEALQQGKVHAGVPYWQKMVHIAELTERLHETTVGKLFLMEQFNKASGSVFDINEVFRPPHVSHGTDLRVSKSIVENSGPIFTSKRSRDTYFESDWTVKDGVLDGEKLGVIFQNFMPALLFYHNTKDNDAISGIELGSEFTSKRDSQMQNPEAFVGEFIMMVLSTLVDGAELHAGFQALKNDVSGGNVGTTEMNRLAQRAGIDVKGKPSQQVKQELDSELSGITSALKSNADLKSAGLSWTQQLGLCGMVASKGYDIVPEEGWAGPTKALGGPKFLNSGFGVVMAGVDIYNQGNLDFDNTVSLLGSLRTMVDDIQLIDEYLATSLSSSNLIKTIGKIGWVFNAIEMISTGMSAYDEFNESDLDASAGMAMQSMAFGCFTAGSLHYAGILAVPGVGWVMAFGISLAIAGTYIYSIGDDSPLQEWFKHCFYGENWDNDEVMLSTDPTDTWFRFKWERAEEREWYARQIAGYYSLVRPIGLEHVGEATYNFAGATMPVGTIVLETEKAYGGNIDDVAIDQNGYIVVKPLKYASDATPVEPSTGSREGVQKPTEQTVYSSAPLHMIRLGDGGGSGYKGTEIDLYQHTPVTYDAGHGKQLYQDLMFYAEPEGRTDDGFLLPGQLVDPVKRWTGTFTANDKSLTPYVNGFEHFDLWSLTNNVFVGSGNYVEVVYLPPEIGRLFDRVVTRQTGADGAGNTLLWKLIDKAPMVSREYMELNG